MAIKPTVLCDPHGLYQRRTPPAMEDKSSFSAIIDDRVYIGNLPAARCSRSQARLGITHVLSVCPDLPSRTPTHHCIPVADSEYENLLIRLPEACRFIDVALKSNGGRGKVLVHCVMGISRSTTVVCAYLMMTRKMSPTSALAFVKKRRPQVHPNYGFMRQLYAFESCKYLPSVGHPDYREWQCRGKREVKRFLSKVEDTVPILPEKLYLSDDFPSEAYEIECLLQEVGITYVIFISPTRIKPEGITSIAHRNIEVPERCREGLLLRLREISDLIRDALSQGEQVLVHCSKEVTACLAVGAYLMRSCNGTPNDAMKVIEAALPLFNSTESFLSQLKLFHATSFNPTLSHDAVRAWIAEDNCSPPIAIPSSTTETQSRSYGSIKPDASPKGQSSWPRGTQAAYQASSTCASRTRSPSRSTAMVKAVSINVQSSRTSPAPRASAQSRSRGKFDLQAVVQKYAGHLSESSFDLVGFQDVLDKIQQEAQGIS